MLHSIPPETAHSIGAWAMRRGIAAPGEIAHPINLFGQELNSAIGLAAGFDKNGHLVMAAQDYGFGWVEVGSVTSRGGPGNSKPRLFRLPNRHLLNRMGLNGDPAEVIAARLEDMIAPFGVSIAKTHDPEIMGEYAVRDIREAYRAVRHLGFYHVLNISCPNTKEGKTFEDPYTLWRLLSEINLHDLGKRPLLVKLSPLADLQNLDPLKRILDVCEHFDIDGYICCNTQKITHNTIVGGLSGPDLFTRSLHTAALVTTTGKPVIGCGGVETRKEFEAYLDLGCKAVQAYTGFVVGKNWGPGFAHKLYD